MPLRSVTLKRKLKSSRSGELNVTMLHGSKNLPAYQFARDRSVILLFGLGSQMVHFYSSQPRRRVAFIEPMECLAVTKLPDGPEWVYEIKLGGYRPVAVKSDSKLNLFSRRRNSSPRDEKEKAMQAQVGEELSSVYLKAKPG